MQVYVWLFLPFYMYMQFYNDSNQI